MPESIKIIAQNRKARRDYHILSTYEAGLQLRGTEVKACLLYTSPSPRDATLSRMPSSA